MLAPASEIIGDKLRDAFQYIMLHELGPLDKELHGEIPSIQPGAASSLDAPTQTTDLESGSAIEEPNSVLETVHPSPAADDTLAPLPDLDLDWSNPPLFHSSWMNLLDSDVSIGGWLPQMPDHLSNVDSTGNLSDGLGLIDAFTQDLPDTTSFVPSDQTPPSAKRPLELSNEAEHIVPDPIPASGPARRQRCGSDCTSTIPPTVSETALHNQDSLVPILDDIPDILSNASSTQTTTDMQPTLQSFKRERQRPVKACITCRKSRKRCDRNKPECGRCSENNKLCVYPESNHNDEIKSIDKQSRGFDCTRVSDATTPQPTDNLDYDGGYLPWADFYDTFSVNHIKAEILPELCGSIPPQKCKLGVSRLRHHLTFIRTKIVSECQATRTMYENMTRSQIAEIGNLVLGKNSLTGEELIRAIRSSRSRSKIQLPIDTPVPVTPGPVFQSSWLKSIPANLILFTKRFSRNEVASALASASASAMDRMADVCRRFVTPGTPKPAYHIAMLENTSLAGDRSAVIQKALTEHLTPVPSKGTVILIIHGLDGFTANIDNWRYLHQRWSDLRIVIAVIESYWRLRSILGEYTLINDQDFLDRIRGGWDIVAGPTTFCGMFDLGQLMINYALPLKERDPHYQYLLSCWAFLNDNRVDVQETIRARTVFNHGRNRTS